MDKALEAVQSMRLDGLEPDVITYTSLIKACALVSIEELSSSVKLAEELFEAMQQRTNHFSSYIEPNELTYQRLINVHLNIILLDDITNAIRDTQRDYSILRVWNLLFSMLKLGMSPGMNIYTNCMKVAQLTNDVGNAMVILDNIRSDRGSIDNFDKRCWSIAVNMCYGQGKFLLGKRIELEMMERGKHL